MRIGIIDAEIIGKNKHRFPNLVCMKLSSYHKMQGDNVTLLLSYDEVDSYDIVYIFKVFIKTEVPCEPKDKSLKTEQTIVEFYQNNPFLHKPSIKFGGTGFYYEKAPKLPDEIEHCKPDYHLYDEWVKHCIKNGAKPKEFVYYTDYSIGFLTRGCFRQCEFCVNKVYKQCSAHSNLSEFIDNSRPKLCFLDDNFFACPNWKEIIEEVQATGKRFQFKQGLDERLLTPEKIQMMGTWKYDGDFIFAFDNIADKDTIINKLEMLYRVNPKWKKQMKFYCFCGFDREGKYDEAFWLKDIEELFERFFILAKYSAHPYVMRHENYKNSPFYHLYDAIAAWVNQPAIYSKFDFDIFCKCRGMKPEGYKKYKRDIEGYLAEYGKKNAPWTYLEDFNKITNNVFDNIFNILPFSLAEYGKYKGKIKGGDSN